MSELNKVIYGSFVQYAGAVLQNRALIDVRDGLKPSARQIFYSMLIRKLTYDNPYKKTANAVGMAMADFYIHGDASCEGVIMRAGQSFAMRYPLVDVKGNAGSLIESGNWAAMRYTESRLSKFSDILFHDIDKETIEEWRNSYDNTKQYPAVLPSKGFYNIVNGSMGIGIGMASSIPQYNLKELNNALIHLIDNPDCDFNEIYCAPDFATGAILYNEKEVKESMKNGTGAACKLRSVVDFDTKERCFVVSEIPYGVYTNTICGQLSEIINGEDNPGIDRFIDLTGKDALLKIYIEKNANPDKILKFLYKNTSLQYYYGVNFTALEDGRFPKTFTWKEMLQAHIDHEQKVYRRGFEFDLRKIEDRIHIIEGLLVCLAQIDEVVKTIKASESTKAASKSLQEKFLLDEAQAKAVLDMKLSRLAHLEVKKLEDEKTELQEKANRIQKILEDEKLLNEEIKKGLREVAAKFGDDRRTKILNLSSNEEDVIEEKSIQVSLTNHNNIYAHEVSTLYTQKRGAVGNKLKLNTGEYVMDSVNLKTTDTIIFFSKRGDCYHCSASDLPLETKTSLFQFVELPESDNIITLTSLTKKPYIVFITKNGILKKSDIKEYNMGRKGPIRAITLDENDEIINALLVKDEKIGILTEEGNFLMTSTIDVRPIGRITKGIIGIKLNEDDHVISAKVIPDDTKFIASISGNGNIKKTSIIEFSLQGRNTKGAKIQKLNELDWLADFLPLKDENEVLVSATSSALKIKVDDIPLQGRGTLGVKAIKLQNKDNIIQISIC